MIENIPTERLHPHPHNPRKDLGDLTELADSIKVHGVLQNLTVVPLMEPIIGPKGVVVSEDAIVPGHYTIVIGHRRHAAAQMAGLAELPCVVSDMDEREQVGTMLLENLQRADLTVIEQAAGFQMMMDLGETVDSIAAKTGFGKRTVQHRLNIAKMDTTKVREALHRGGTLLDFIELEKVTSEKKKARLLEDMGTSNWKMSISRALEEQEYPERKKMLLDLLKGWAKHVKARDWNRDDAVKYFYGYKLEGEFEKPADADKADYVYTDSGHDITLLRRKKKETKDKKPSRKEAEFEERKAQMNEVTRQAYELRYAFVKDFSAYKKGIRTIMDMAVYGLAMLGYGRAEREKVLEMLGIELPTFPEPTTYDVRAKAMDALIEECFDINPERVFFFTAYCRLEAEDTLNSAAIN